MSQSVADVQRSDQENESVSNSEDIPEVEEDLLHEELRIDGGCQTVQYT